MKITWLGHSGFRIEIAGQILLVDPWLTGNPAFPGDRRDAAVAGATHILLTHGHGDHAGDAEALARQLDVEVVCIHELAEYFGGKGVKSLGFSKGGTVDLGGVAVTMVTALHSSSIDFAGGTPLPAGSEAGFMISGEGHTIYVSGDTDVTADMGVMNDLHSPDIGILCAGGHYTMDMKRAAYAAKTFFDFKVVIPCHFRTFPLLAQSADVLVAALPDVDIRTPAVMEVMEF